MQSEILKLYPEEMRRALTLFHENNPQFNWLKEKMENGVTSK